MSKISIIVPVYNVESYLARCINSILAQTFQDFDLILVDDGSPDRSGHICDEYAAHESRIHVIHQKNGGLSVARNTGIEWAFEKSNSRWISFIDSDDWIHPKYLEVLYSAVIRDHTQVAIGGALWTDGEVLPEQLDEASVLWKPEDYYLKDATNATVSWGKIYWKNLFKNIRFPKGKLHEDEFVTYRILFSQPYISVVDSPIYAYFQNVNGITLGRWNTGRLSVFDVLEIQIDFFLENNYERIARQRFEMFFFNVKRHQKSIIECEELEEEEKRKLLKSIKKRMRHILLKYRNRHWLSFRTNEESREIYMYAFPMLRISRSIWLRTKSLLKRVPPVHSLGKLAKRCWRQREVCKEVINYIRKTILVKAILMQSPIHGNLGDQAIAVAELNLLRNLGVSCFDYPWTEGREQLFAKYTSKRKTILVHGGGFLGILYPNEEQRFRDTLKAYSDSRIIVLPQTIFFDLNSEEGRRYFLESKEIYEAHPNLTIFVRERFSFEFMKNHMPDIRVELVPDVVMGMEYIPGKFNREGALICLRRDKEKILKECDSEVLYNTVSKYYETIHVTDTIIPESVMPDQREKVVCQKLQEFSSSELVVTDRLHGMIFSAITETPCIILDSLSPKIKGSYEWIQNLDYICFAETVDEIPELIARLKGTHPFYDYEKIRHSMKPLYETIKSLGNM